MKRLVSLTMAAACAMSLAVPAFAAGSVAKDSGYSEVVVSSINGVKAAEEDADGKIVLKTTKANATVTIDGVKLSVPGRQWCYYCFAGSQAGTEDRSC